jgi:hypothetical protein
MPLLRQSSLIFWNFVDSDVAESFSTKMPVIGSVDSFRNEKYVFPSVLGVIVTVNGMGTVFARPASEKADNAPATIIQTTCFINLTFMVALLETPSWQQLFRR